MARKKGPLVDTAYEMIRDRILSFEYLPGQAISDYLLSQELQMSRTPVREAIQNLMRDGLVVQGETRLLVSPLTERDIREICQLREALECKAVDLIIGRGGLSERQKQRLFSINEEMRGYVEKGDHLRNFKTDDIFHAAILEYSQNSRLIDCFERLRLQIARARWLTVIHPFYMDSLKEHQDIAESIARGSLEDARRAAEQHMRNAEDHFSAIFHNEDILMSMKSLQLLTAQKFSM